MPQDPNNKSKKGFIPKINASDLIGKISHEVALRVEERLVDIRERLDTISLVLSKIEPKNDEEKEIIENAKISIRESGKKVLEPFKELK